MVGNVDPADCVFDISALSIVNVCLLNGELDLSSCVALDCKTVVVSKELDDSVDLLPVFLMVDPRPAVTTSFVVSSVDPVVGLSVDIWAVPVDPPLCSVSTEET